MSANAVNGPVDDEIAAFLQETEEEQALPVVARPTLHSEVNFSHEAYYAVSHLRDSICRVGGLMDFCRHSAEIRKRLEDQGNDPEVLRARLMAHCSRLNVELRALTALLYGSNI